MFPAKFKRREIPNYIQGNGMFHFDRFKLRHIFFAHLCQNFLE